MSEHTVTDTAADPAATAPTAPPDTAVRISAAELRTLFLFEKLDDAQLALLADAGRLEPIAAGSWAFRAGEPATCLFVLMTGSLVMYRPLRGEDVEVNRTDQRGVYAGATQAYLGGGAESTYTGSVQAQTDCTFFVLPAAVFGDLVRDWFPMAMHLLEGLFFGLRSSQARIDQRERLLALGQLSAGLTHELNNPAAAAVRATATLRERVAKMRQKLVWLADGHIDGDQLHRLVALQDQAVQRSADPPHRSALEAADAEEAVADWLDEHGIAEAYDIAETLSSAGLDPAWLDRLTDGAADSVSPEVLASAVRWLSYTVETETLMREIVDSTRRISTLVDAAKQYSQMDRAPYQRTDLHDGLDSTLIMLSRKLVDSITVVKDYDRSLPPVPAYAAEINQVWTNLIDNAIQAMDGRGTLTLRTERRDDCAVVTVGDTGAGVPADLRTRIFEPFFTTKPPGQGTGLGLDISYRIVVKKHHGDIRLTSRPGDTRFEVWLPLTES
jgi:signal transduction histidine kinase